MIAIDKVLQAQVLLVQNIGSMIKTIEFTNVVRNSK